MDFTRVLESLQETALDAGVKELAAEFDIAASNLYTQLNPYGEKNIPFVRALHIMAREGDFSTLDAYLEPFGLRIVRKNPRPDGQDMNHECLQAYEASGRFLTRASQGAHYTELLPLLEVSVKELDDVLARRRKENEESRKQ